MTHCRSESAAPSDAWIVGRATFTIETSRRTMKKPRHVIASVIARCRPPGPSNIGRPPSQLLDRTHSTTISCVMQLISPILVSVLGRTYEGQNCSLARALEVVGERWTPLILRDTLLRPRRFDELLQRLGVARNVLAERLQGLCDDGLLERRLYQAHPPRYE